MGIDINVLTDNAGKLDGCIDKNEKREQDRKDEQLYNTIERKVKKEEHKRKKPRGRDGTIKECKKLFKEGASPEVLTKLEESLRGQEKYHKYYVECFLPVLGRKISKESDLTKEEKIGQVISGITGKHNDQNHYNRRNSEDSEPESGYGSDVEDDCKVETNNRVTNNSVQLLEAIKNRNNRKFKKHLKDYTNISGIKGEKENNILHLIASLERKQKLKFLGTLIKTATEESLAQLINGENQDGKTPLQVALINKITKERHESCTIRGNDNTLKFLTKSLGHGASYDNLRLSTEELQNLKEEQKTYYCNFLEKLAESVRQSTLEQKIDVEKKIKVIILYTINTPNSNNDYPLHLAIENKTRFEELLQKGADVSLKDANGDNALHLITKLKKKQKLEFLNTVLKVSKEEREGQLKEQLIKAVNDKSGDGKNSNSQTPLHQLLQHIQEKSKKSSLGNKIQNIVKKEFKATSRYQTLELFLQNGADINKEDGKGNNALHYIVSFKGEQKTICLGLILDSVKEEKIPKERLGEVVNSKNQEEQTPLHQLLQHIKGKNEDRSCTDRKFEKTNKYETLELLLKNGADITVKDGDKKNALHYIASLKGEQKVTCLDLIVEKGNIPENKLSKAINARNGKKQTPLQVALIAKIMKNKHSKVSFISRDNTIKFCVKLLQNGADPKQLILPESLWNREYYKTIKGMEKSMGRSLISDDMRTELKLNFGKKFKACDIVKYASNVARKIVTTLVFVALTCAAIFSAAQGSITAAAASSIIAAIGVCYLIYLNLENIYEGFKKLKGKFTEEKQITPQSNASKNDAQCNNSSQNMENKPNDPEEQKPSDQSKHIESPPSPKVDNILIQGIKGLLELN
ncbi:ankyrin repeat domain-containing protein [Candidatus Wolbachia massiliensis]|uniref:Ankyrin repeat domain-containing protein n=1 Tax=Candidatus Wolbachia massiliensis TaxID=1845000 RepID=A0A7L7YRB8_9RICK|nr:ankyrin repeat domain-containing protein [Candidatus Wolbachia massiliensis]QOD38296.1 ankyrin repeat domain-containing protein [Candidatus Wolbachia massiliensis]